MATKIDSGSSVGKVLQSLYTDTINCQPLEWENTACKIAPFVTCTVFLGTLGLGKEQAALLAGLTAIYTLYRATNKFIIKDKLDACKAMETGLRQLASGERDVKAVWRIFRDILLINDFDNRADPVNRQVHHCFYKLSLVKLSLELNGFRGKIDQEKIATLLLNLYFVNKVMGLPETEHLYALKEEILTKIGGRPLGHIPNLSGHIVRVGASEYMCKAGLLNLRD